MFDMVKGLLDHGDEASPPNGVGGIRIPQATLHYLVTLVRDIGGSNASLAAAAYGEIPGVLDDLIEVSVVQRRNRAGLTNLLMPMPDLAPPFYAPQS